jgi:hypothetical protein
MTKPWTVLVAGGAGLLVLVVVAKQFRGAGSAESSPSGSRIEAAARTEHSGWTAREDADSPQAGTGGLHGSTIRGGGGSAGSGALTGGRDLPSERGAGRHGAGFVAGGNGRRSGSIAHGAGSTYSASDAIHADTNVPAIEAPVPGAPVGARGRGLDAERATVNQPRAGTDVQAPDTANKDPNAPVLSLSFSNTTQPDKGSQPIFDEGVSCGDEGCTFDTNSRFAIPDAANLTGEAGSISFCLQPQWSGTDPGNAGFVDLQTPNQWENQLNVFKNGDYFRLRMIPNSGVESGVSAKITNWQPGQGHAVTVTFGVDPTTGQNMASLYLDGNLAGRQPYQGQFDVPNQPLYIGSDFPGGQPGASATLNSFQAYNRVQTPEEAANFAVGCPQ